MIAQLTGLSQGAVRYHVRGITVQTTVKRRREPEPPPVPPEPSADLAYFIGVFAGDGSLSRLPRTYKLGIACDNRYPDLIAGFASLLGRLTGRKVSTFARREAKCTDVIVHGPHLSTLLGVPSGRKSDNGFAIPEWVFDTPAYARLFVRGLIETDGGIYYRHRADKGRTWECIFVASNEHIMISFLRAASGLGFRFRRSGTRASLSNSGEVRRLMQDCGISKHRDYTIVGASHGLI